MALPPSWSLIPVTGTFLKLDGTPCKGTILFYSDQVVVIDHTVVVPLTIQVTLDENGSIPAGFGLPSTSAPQLNVTGWAYTVHERIDSSRARPRYSIFVEHTAAEINLANVAPVVPPEELVSAMGLPAVVAAQDAADRAEAAAADAAPIRADLAASTGAALVGIKQAGTGAVYRTLADKLAEIVSVTDFGAVGDGVANDTTAITAAVTYAASVGARVDWPEGSYVTTAAIPGLHDVKHIGAGKLRRGSAVFPLVRSSLDTLKLYVNPTGSDTNDGLSASQPLATLGRAAQIVTRSAPVVGRWEIHLAAGTYSETVDFASMTVSTYPIDIIGPTVAHPGVPTAVIQSPTGSGPVLSFADGGWFRLRYLRVTGATNGTGIELQRTRVGMTNVHIDNCLNGVTTLHGAMLSVDGGIWSGLGAGVAGGFGYRPYYNSTHSLVGPNTAGALIIQNYELGLLLGEGVQGHLDYTVVQDCGTGVHIARNGGGCNTRLMTVRRCAVGVDARASWMNNGISFGTGADSNTVNVRTTGGGFEYYARATSGWSKTKRLQDMQFDIGPHTGTTTTTQVYEWDGIRPWMVSEGGDTIDLRLVLTAPVATVGTVSVHFYMWDGTTEDYLSGVQLLPGTTLAIITGNVLFESATRQRFSGVAAMTGGNLRNILRSISALDFKNKSGALRVKVSLTDAADSVTIDSIELNTTLGG